MSDTCYFSSEIYTDTPSSRRVATDIHTCVLVRVWWPCSWATRSPGQIRKFVVSTSEWQTRRPTMHPSVKGMRLNIGRNKLAMGLATQVCESWVKSQCFLVLESKFLCYKNPGRNNDIVAQEGISRWATQVLSPSSHHIICAQLSPRIGVPFRDVAFIRLASHQTRLSPPFGQETTFRAVLLHQRPGSDQLRQPCLPTNTAPP